MEGRILSRLVVVSNRVAIPKGGRLPPGGLAIGVLAALKQYGGLWFGWSGEVTRSHRVKPVKVTQGNITYVTINLQHQEQDQYYNGFCNGVLWPLFHYLPQFMNFQREHWRAYQTINQLFAHKLIPLLQPDDLIWVHDYHLMLLAQELHTAGISNPIGFFLHIPFPAYGLLRTMPRHTRILSGLCQYDLVGFQTPDDLLAFRNCVTNDLGGKLIDDHQLEVADRKLRAGVFPIGIDVSTVKNAARKSLHSHTRERLIKSLARRPLIIGVDRLDYSKGLINRLQAYELFLENYPENLGRAVFLQIAPQSREQVRAYGEIQRELEEAAGRINGRFAEFDWMPIRYLNQSFGRTTLIGFLRIAQVGLVTPVRDGMNLVAKEYVAAQNPADPGVLILSSLAGAARELDAALLVNPFDVYGVAEALQTALNMSLAERKERHTAMMEKIRGYDISTWRRNFVQQLQATGK
jgi:trehalose 6-phosphate synthase